MREAEKHPNSPLKRIESQFPFKEPSHGFNSSSDSGATVLVYLTGSDCLLSITYFGHTSFALESKGTVVLLNPGIWENEPVVPDDFSARIVVATNREDDAIGNSAIISVNSKAWFLGNKETVEKATEQGVKPWLLHVLENEVPYEVPDVRVIPYNLSRIDEEKGGRIDNLGLLIEIGGMKIGYLGDTSIRGPFEQLEMDILIGNLAPILKEKTEGYNTKLNILLQNLDMRKLFLKEIKKDNQVVLIEPLPFLYSSVNYLSNIKTELIKDIGHLLYIPEQDDKKKKW